MGAANPVDYGSRTPQSPKLKASTQKPTDDTQPDVKPKSAKPEELPRHDQYPPTPIHIQPHSGEDTLKSMEVKKCMEETPDFKASAAAKEKLIRALLDLELTPNEIIKLLRGISSTNWQENMLISIVLPKTIEYMLKKGFTKHDTIDYVIKSAELDGQGAIAIIPNLLDTGLSPEEITQLLEKVMGVTPKAYTWAAYKILPDLIDHGLTFDDIASILRSSIDACNGNALASMFPCITGLMNIGLPKDDILKIIKFTYRNGSNDTHDLHFISLYEGIKLLKALQEKGSLDGRTLFEILNLFKEKGRPNGHGIYSVIPELAGRGYKIDEIEILLDLIKEKSGKQADLFYLDLSNRLKSGEPLESILEEYNYLWDLNITWINRFSKKARAEIISNRLNPEPDGRPLAVILLPKSDWNGAFATDVEIYDELIAKGYRVMVFEEPTDEARWKAIQEATREQKASLIVWAGHGTKGSVQFGEGYLDTDQLDIGDEAEMMSLKLGDSLEEGGTVLCFSCSTGKGEEGDDNIGNMLARVFPHASHVWAPTKDTSIEKLLYDESNTVIGIQYGEPVAYDAHLSLEYRLNQLAEIHPELKDDIDNIKKQLVTKRNNLYFDKIKPNI